MKNYITNIFRNEIKYLQLECMHVTLSCIRYLLPLNNTLLSSICSFSTYLIITKLREKNERNSLAKLESPGTSL